MRIQDAIQCPKCNKPFLKKVDNPNFGKEYFCHFCHIYFGTNELVNQFGYDAGDLCPYPVTHAQYKGWVKKNRTVVVGDLTYCVNGDTYYSEFDEGEPYWNSITERDEAYEVVANMYADISEMEAFELRKNNLDNGYTDLIATQEDALDRSIQ